MYPFKHDASVNCPLGALLIHVYLARARALCSTRDQSLKFPARTSHGQCFLENLVQSLGQVGSEAEHLLICSAFVLTYGDLISSCFSARSLISSVSIDPE